MSEYHTSPGQPPPLGNRWVKRFLDRHPDILAKKQRMRDLKRRNAENVQDNTDWFSAFHEVCTENQIPDETETARPVTPPPPTDIIFTTPKTVRGTQRLVDHIQEEILKVADVPADLVARINQLNHGAQTQALEAKKAMLDLHESDLAKRMRKLNDNVSRRHVFSGGLLSIEECRHIVDNRETERLEKEKQKEERE
ncbi:hypothetical protein P152DRAFT_473089 [Eremomyces bilateralis CBS 781.70]|uniref:HTH CENPB-type domain-containing protein n=1 Tax=Eremomyces bilateralis CBS 781.70 TaxID=1392243 RepID=A0A6G1G5I6_9PEZI|nr:uncharacterized protein P152DRAFT_473089 [Eremomyces bilateralis CBS 781.70]KAF1813355.1 hypothetical protein P152DRAFT_473089 [Eremomyces bilateralis CBS 781.70]